MCFKEKAGWWGSDPSHSTAHSLPTESWRVGRGQTPISGGSALQSTQGTPSPTRHCWKECADPADTRAVLDVHIRRGFSARVITEEKDREGRAWISQPAGEQHPVAPKDRAEDGNRSEQVPLVETQMVTGSGQCLRA